MGRSGSLGTGAAYVIRFGGVGLIRSWEVEALLLSFVSVPLDGLDFDLPFTVFFRSFASLASSFSSSFNRLAYSASSFSRFFLSLRLSLPLPFFFDEAASSLASLSASSRNRLCRSVSFAFGCSSGMTILLRCTTRLSGGLYLPAGSSSSLMTLVFFSVSYWTYW